MIDPNIYVLTRATHEHRSKEALKHQRHWQPFSNDWYLHSGFWPHTALDRQDTEGSMLQERIRCWLGAQLVKWGFRLQGYRGTMLPPVPECEPYNG